MKEVNTVGVWLDRYAADLIECFDEVPIETIHAHTTPAVEIVALSSMENGTHQHEGQHPPSFYEAIAEKILAYDIVLLFGPTNAKIELYDYLKNNEQFNKVKFEMQAAGKMTDAEKLAFVKRHFKKNAR